MNGSAANTNAIRGRDRVHVVIPGPHLDQGTGLRVHRGGIHKTMGEKCVLPTLREGGVHGAMYHLEAEEHVRKIKREKPEHQGVGLSTAERGSSAGSSDRGLVQKQEVYSTSPLVRVKQEKGGEEAGGKCITSTISAKEHVHEMESKKAIKSGHSVKHEGFLSNSTGKRTNVGGTTDGKFFGTNNSVASIDGKTGAFKSEVPNVRHISDKELDERIIKGQNGQHLFVLGGRARRNRLELGSVKSASSVDGRVEETKSDVYGGERRGGGGRGNVGRVIGGSGQGHGFRAILPCEERRGIVPEYDMRKGSIEEPGGGERNGVHATGVGGHGVALHGRDGKFDHGNPGQNKSNDTGVSVGKESLFDRIRQGIRENLGERTDEKNEQNGHLPSACSKRRKQQGVKNTKKVRFSGDDKGGRKKGECGHGGNEETGDINLWLRTLSDEVKRSEENGRNNGVGGIGEERKIDSQGSSSHQGKENEGAVYRPPSPTRAPVRRPGRPPKPKDSSSEGLYKESRKSHRLPPNKRGNKADPEGEENSEQWLSQNEFGRDIPVGASASDEAFRCGAGFTWLHTPDRFSDKIRWEYERNTFKRLESVCKIMGMPFDFTSKDPRYGIVHYYDDVVRDQMEHRNKRANERKESERLRKKQRVMSFADKYGLPIVRQEYKTEEEIKIITKEKGYVSVIEMPSVFKGRQVPNFHLKEPIQIINITATFWLGVLDIDKNKLAATLPGAFYNCERFKSVILPFILGDVACKPSMIASISHTGKVVLPGARSEVLALEGAHRIVEHLRKDGGLKSVDVKFFKIENIVACANIGHGVNLVDFTANNPTSVVWHPERFPAAMYRPLASKCIALMYPSGNFVVAGAKDEEEIREIAMHVYENGEKYKTAPDSTITASDLRLLGRQLQITDMQSYNEIKGMLTNSASTFDNMLDNVSFVSGDGQKTITYGGVRDLLQGGGEEMENEREMLVSSVFSNVKDVI